MKTSKLTCQSEPVEDLPKGYISDPKTMPECIQNANFQLDNVSGWMSANCYGAALIKARCLVDALELLVKQSQMNQNHDIPLEIP